MPSFASRQIFKSLTWNLNLLVWKVFHSIWYYKTSTLVHWPFQHILYRQENENILKTFNFIVWTKLYILWKIIWKNLLSHLSYYHFLFIHLFIHSQLWCYLRKSTLYGSTNFRVICWKKLIEIFTTFNKKKRDNARFILNILIAQENYF